jgi:hypothetical protein
MKILLIIYDNESCNDNTISSVIMAGFISAKTGGDPPYAE